MLQLPRTFARSLRRRLHRLDAALRVNRRFSARHATRPLTHAATAAPAPCADRSRGQLRFDHGSGRAVVELGRRTFRGAGAAGPMTRPDCVQPAIAAPISWPGALPCVTGRSVPRSSSTGRPATRESRSWCVAAPLRVCCPSMPCRNLNARIGRTRFRIPETRARSYRRDDLGALRQPWRTSEARLFTSMVLAFCSICAW
jgi:hypothetical protein